MKKDKINHIFAGALIASAVGMPCYLNNVDLFAGLWGSIVSAIIAGSVKEWCDNQYGNGMDWKDFLFTVIGSLVPVLFILGLHFGKG